jgi:hypothetical protein
VPNAPVTNRGRRQGQTNAFDQRDIGLLAGAGGREYDCQLILEAPSEVTSGQAGTHPKSDSVSFGGIDCVLVDGEWRPEAE